MKKKSAEKCDNVTETSKLWFWHDSFHRNLQTFTD